MLSIKHITHTDFKFQYLQVLSVSLVTTKYPFPTNQPGYVYLQLEQTNTVLHFFLGFIPTPAHVPQTHDLQFLHINHSTFESQYGISQIRHGVVSPFAALSMTDGEVLSFFADDFEEGGFGEVFFHFLLLAACCSRSWFLYGDAASICARTTALFFPERRGADGYGRS